MPLTAAAISIADLPESGVASPSGFRRWGPAPWLVLLSAVYLVPTCIRAAREKLWFDEIGTFNAAALVTSPGRLWSFLKVDGVFPPLGFALAAGSESVFGRSEFGLRFPSVIAFWIMALCVYLFFRRRLPWPYGIAAMLLTSLTAAGRYSYEARPYAVMLALAGIALVAWQAAAEGRRRRTALVALAVALVGALLSHAMAVTLALPLLAGELTRTVQRKRLDWPVWCAFASATPALLVLWTLKTAGNASAYWRFNGSLSLNIFNTYLEMLGPAITPLILALLAVLVLRGQSTSPSKRTLGIRGCELAALVGFAIIPFVAVPLSTLGGMYFPRYSLNCTIGLAGLIAVLLFRIGGTNRLSGAAVLAAFGMSFVMVQSLPEEKRPDYGLKVLNASEKIQPFLERMPSDAPIVIGPPMTFVELEHYSRPGLAARLYYLTEPAVEAAIDGDVLFDVKMPMLARFYPFRAHYENYHSFVAAYKRFYVVQPIRKIVREQSLGRLSLLCRETAEHFQYYEANAR